jgi:hypothetical protein
MKTYIHFYTDLEQVTRLLIGVKKSVRSCTDKRTTFYALSDFLHILEFSIKQEIMTCQFYGMYKFSTLIL